jgi:hypothetical protein
MTTHRYSLEFRAGVPSHVDLAISAVGELNPKYVRRMGPGEPMPHEVVWEFDTHAQVEQAIARLRGAMLHEVRVRPVTDVSSGGLPGTVL